MDKELEEIRRRKMMELLNKRNHETILVKIFDLLVPASACDPSCGPSGCEPGGCGPSFTSPNMMKLQMLASRLIQKYGRDRFKFELFNVLDSSIQKFNNVYNILKERKANGLPIISIDDKIKFIGRVPTFEEFEKEIKVVM